MSDAPTPDAPKGAQVQAGAEPAPSEDDFLYHLYRGSELLLQDRVVEAKGELERALGLQPQDAKGQDLLAGVYFRLGLYPRAIEIWERLARAYPKDSTLRVNLSLALLKTGQPAQALDHIHTALQLSPDHDRAWGYLGLVHWRTGRYDEARDAFLRGGQAAMARRMEDIIATSTATGNTMAPPDGAGSGRGERAAMRSAAEQAIARFEAEQVPLAVEPQAANRPSGAWRVDEPGAEATPERPRAPRVAPLGAPPLLESLIDAWSVALPDDVSLAVAATGELHLQTRDEVHCRLEGLRAVRGELRTTPVQRRARGRDLPDLLGGEDPLMLWHGPVGAILEAPAGQSFHATTLVDDILFVREELVAGFDGRIHFESGRVPLAKGELTLLQLHGSGTVVLRLRRAPSALRVTEGDEVRVAPDALVGWTGRLLPRGPRARGTAPYSLSAPPLAFRGDGIVLVT